MKDVLAKGAGLKRQHPTSKHEISFLVSFLCVTFALLVLDPTPSADPDMGPADKNHGTDPDSQH